MNEASRAAAAALQLPDDVFYSDTSVAFDQLVGSLAPVDPPQPNPGQPTPEPSPVFALGLPRLVAPARGQDLPGALAVRQDALREWAVDLRQNLCMVIVDLSTGSVRTTAPFKPTKRLASAPTPSRSAAAPSGLQARITMRSVERIKLLPVFGESWPSSSYAVTAISYDWASNTRVVVRSPAPAAAPPLSSIASSFVEPGRTATATLPPGLSLSLPSAATTGAPLRIDFGVSAPAASVSLLDGATDGPQRLLMASLLLFRLDAPRPMVLSLAVPVSSHAGDVSGSFSFDLHRRPEAAELSGEYQVYLFSGRSFAGPRHLTIGRR